MARIRRIRSQDGTLVPFRERVIADQIQLALDAAGDGDRALAEELAGVVTLFLAKYHADGTPDQEDVEEMMVRALRETGKVSAASCLTEILEHRTRLQAEVTVRYPQDFSYSADAIQPAGEGASDVEAWDRTRLVKSLVMGEELPESLAEEIAGSVERCLMAARLKSVTPGLIRELIDHDMLKRGLERRERPAPGHIGRSELLEVIAGEGARTPDRVIAERALTRYALTELHGDAAVRAHAEGGIHLFGLGDPLKVERLVLPADLLLHPSAGSVHAEANSGQSVDDAQGRAEPRAKDTGLRAATKALLTLRAHLESLRDHVREEMVLPDLVGTLAQWDAAREDPTSLAEWLFAALDFRDAYGESQSPSARLVIPLGAPRCSSDQAADSMLPFLEALWVRVADQEPSRMAVPLALAWPGAGRKSEATTRSFEYPEDDILLPLLKVASLRPHTQLSLHRAAADQLFPESCARPAPLTISLGRLALNLPLMMVHAHGGSLKEVLSDLDATLVAARSAMQEKFWHQRKGARQGLHGVVVRMGGPGQVEIQAQNQEVDVEVWGLGHTLELLVRRGVISDASRPEAAARVLGYLDYQLGEDSGGVKFRVRLGGTRDRDVRRRFLSALEGHAERFGVMDVQDMLREDPERDRSTLPVVVPLLSRRNAPLLDAPFAENIGPGLALPLAAFGGGSPSELLPRLVSETRLGLLTLAPPRPGEDLFEVQEELFA